MEVRPEASSDFESALTSILGPIIDHAGLIAFAALPIAAGVALLKIGDQFDDAFHKIQQLTGATGTQLSGLEQSFKDVFSSTPGANFTNTAQAIGLVYEKTGLTGKGLDDLSAKFIELGKITGTDVTADIQQVTGIFGQFGVVASQQSGQLDVLYKAARDAGESFSTFAGNLNTVTPTAQTLGLTLDQTAALTSNLDKLGLPTSKTMLALGTAFSKAAKAGEDPTKVIANLIDTIKKAPDASTAAQEAIKDFGLNARSAATFVDGVRKGVFTLGGTLNDITNGKGGITDTAFSTLSLGDKFDILKNKALVALQPIAGKVLDLAEGIADKIPEAIGIVQKVWGGLVAGFENPGADIEGKNPIAVFVLKLGQDIRKGVDYIKGLWSDLVDGFNGTKVNEGGLSKIGDIAFKIGQDIQKALPYVKDFIGWIEANWKPILAGAAIALGLLIAPEATVVVGLIAAYEHFKTFRVVVNDVVGWLKNTAYPDVRTFFLDLAHAVVDAIHIWEDNWSKIRNTVAPVIDFITKEVRDMAHILSGIFGTISDLLTGQWGKAWGQISDVASHTWDLIKTTVNDGIKIVYNLMKDFGPTLLKISSTIWNNIDQALRTALGDVWKDVMAIPAKILDLLGDAGKLLYNWGADVLKGLIKGVEDALGGIGNVVKDIKDKFTSALTSLFKIGSPSKLTYQHGQWIGEGLALGIESAIPSITRTTASIGAAVTAGLGGIGGGGLKVNVAGLPKPGSANTPGETVGDKQDKTNDLLTQLLQATKYPPQTGQAPGATWGTPTGQTQPAAPGIVNSQMRTLAATRQR